MTVNLVWAAPQPQLLLMLSALIFFHASEVCLVLMYGPQEFSYQSLLLSKQYIAALAAGLIEFGLGWMVIPHIKRDVAAVTVPLGMLMIFTGEALRKLAWITARRAFTHLIREERQKDHALVTHGVYSMCRHPGYLGWSLWAVGTQVMLGNPVCVILYSVVSWRFFQDRIAYEECMLRRMFGQHYAAYALKVPSGLPWIK